MHPRRLLSILMSLYGIHGCAQSEVSPSPPTPLQVDAPRTPEAPDVSQGPEAPITSKPRAAAVEELVRRLEPTLARSATGLVQETDARGRVSIRLKGRFGHAVLVRRSADGQLQYECADHAAEAQRFLAGEGQTGGVTVDGL